MIQTSRLTLRPFSPSDEAAVIDLLMCPEFMAYSPTGAMEKEAANQRFYQLLCSYQLNGLGKLAVVVKSCGTLIGYCGIEVCAIDGVQRPELGFRLQTSYRGKGYATEAATALLSSNNIDGVVAFTEPTNHASIKVLAKLGFRQTGISSFRGMPVILFDRRM